MKLTIAASLLVLAGWSVFGQGTVLFQNIGPTIDAPVIGPTGRKVSGENFKAELLVGRTPTSLTPVATTPISNDPIQAGYFLGGVVTLDGYSGGTKPFFEVLVWDSNTGATYSTATSKAYRGVFQLGVPLGDSMGGPAFLIGLTSIRFPLDVPEASTLALVILGGFGLFFCSRDRYSAQGRQPIPRLRPHDSLH